MNEIIYWIWLSLSTTPGAPTFKRLIDVFDDAKSIYDAEIFEISKYIGSRSSDRSKLCEKDLTEATQVYEYCVKMNIGILTYADERFPVSLREIDTAPVLLYYRGVLPDFNKCFSFAIVGTRTLSDYGRCSAFIASYEMASAGAVIVSGMAMGIDAVAHAGALAAGGKTVAVIGSGINICYPEEHRTLAREIVKSGCVLSEFRPGTPPSKTTFPKRNRLISGLCAATLVIEGRERSGSLITARCAKDQGRVVYALPGNVGAKNSEATNQLIKCGAKLFTSSDDVVRDFELIYRGVLNPFLLPKKFDVDIKAALRRYSVVAVAPSDDIFEPPHRFKRNEESILKQILHKKTDTPVQVYSDTNETISLSKDEDIKNTPPIGFDKTALLVYKKIPISGECEIEALTDAELSMRDVMQSLLKLEMGHFVEMCPGERVKRKSK